MTKYNKRQKHLKVVEDTTITERLASLENELRAMGQIMDRNTHTFQQCLNMLEVRQAALYRLLAENGVEVDAIINALPQFMSEWVAIQGLSDGLNVLRAIRAGDPSAEDVSPEGTIYTFGDLAAQHRRRVVLEHSPCQRWGAFRQHVLDAAQDAVGGHTVLVDDIKGAYPVRVEIPTPVTGCPEALAGERYRRSRRFEPQPS